MIFEESLMGRRVVELDEGLMPLLQLGRGAGEGELIVVQPVLYVKVRLHSVPITLALGADDRLVPDLQPGTHRLNVGRRRGPAAVGH
jgi:hypothetical protein